MSRYLAIDADAGGLFVASASVRGGGVQIEHALAVLDDSPANLTLTNAAALGIRLKAVMKEAGIAPAPVLICFGRDRVIVKDVKFPPVAPSEEAAAVRFQAQKDLADSADVVMDYFTTESAPGEVLRRATVVFVRKDLYAAAQEFCSAAGLKLAAVSARPFASLAAVRRAIAIGAAPPPEDPQAPTAVLTLWGTGGEFAVGRGSQTLYSRTISSMSLSSETALLGDIKRSLASFNGQSIGKPIQTLYLAEGDSTGTSWIGRLQASAGLPVHAIDPLAGSKSTGEVPPELHGRFLGAVGMLASKTSSEKLNVNFLAPRSPRSAPNKNKRLMVMGGMVFALFLVVAGGFLYLQMLAADKESVRLQREKTDLEDQTKGQELDNKRVDAAQAFVKREVPWIDIYYDLNDQFPTLDKLRLQDFHGEIVAQAPVKAGAAKTPASATPPTAAGATKPGIKPGDKPIGKITLLILSEDGTLPEKLKDTLNKEPGILNARTSTGGFVGGSGSKVSQYTINADVYARKPSEFTRKLAAPPPPPKIVPVAPKPPEEVEPFDPFAQPGGGQ